MNVSRRGLFSLLFGGTGVFVADKALAIIEPPKPKVVEVERVVEKVVERRVGAPIIANCVINEPLTIEGDGALITGCYFNSKNDKPFVTAKKKKK